MDWVTISSLATAGGTLVLGVATFASVRSANRASRVAERGLLAGLRPVLVHSRVDDAAQKVGFIDGKWMRVPGGQAQLETSDGAVWLAVSLRNVGTGLAVLHGWQLNAGWRDSPASPELDGFNRLTRDLYIAPGDTGFWQGTFRDPASPAFAAARASIEAREQLSVDILYGDLEGGQRAVTRFGLTPRDDGAWAASAGRVWNVDLPDPR